MSRKNKKRRYTQAQLEQKRIAKKQAKLFALQKNITIFALLIILILGLVSTTFSTSIFDSLENNEGTLVAQVHTAAKQKTDLASTKANVDVANTGANLKCIFIYDNSQTKWSNVYLMVGHGSYSSSGYQMTKISNTNLYYYNMSSQWGGATEILVMDTKWSSENSSLSHRHGYMSGVQNSNVLSGFGDMTSNIQLLTGDSGSDDFTLSSTYHSSYTGLNTTQTATVQVSTNGTSYSASTAGGSTTISTYKLSSGTASTTSSGTTSGSSTTADAARSATVTMKATAKTGYSFAGWYDSSGTQKTTSTTLTYTCNGSEATYYARFKKQYTVTYIVDGSTHSTEKVLAGNKPKSYPTPASRTGYTGKWDATPSSTTITKNTTFTYTYTPNTYKVTLNQNGGSGGTASVTATYGSAMPAITLPSREGHTFKGYWTTSSGTGTQYYTETGASARTWNQASTDTLYAFWEANKYDVKLYLDGATFVNTNANITSYTYGVGATLPTAEDMSKEGYTFLGWYTSQYYLGDPVTSISTTETGIKNFYARWIKNSSTLTIVKAVDSGINAESFVVTANGVEVTPDSDGVYHISAESAVTLDIIRPNSNVYFESVVVTYDTTQQGYSELNGDFSEDIIESMDTDYTVAYSLSYKPKLTFTNNNDTHIKTQSLKYLNDGVETTVTPSANGSVYVDYDSDVTYVVTLKDNNEVFISDITGLETTIDSTATVATGVSTRVQGNITVTPVLTSNKMFTLNYIDNSELPEQGFKYYINDVAYDLGTGGALPYGVATPVKVIPPQGYYARIYVDNGTTLLDTTEITYSKGSAMFDVTVTDTDVTYYVEYVKNPTISVTQPYYGSIYVTSVDEETDETVYYFNGDEVYGGTNLTVHIVPDNSNFAVSTVAPLVTETDTDNEYAYQIFSNTEVTATITGNASNTDFIATDDKNQQAKASKYDRVVFTYDASQVNDYDLSCRVVNENSNGEKDGLRYSFANGKFTVIPTSNINDTMLIEVSSVATGTVKYYLIKLNSFASTQYSEIQKIYDVTSGVGLNLSGDFSNILAKIGFYVSEDNSLFNELKVSDSSFSDYNYKCDFKQTDSGVRYYKITATDTEGNEASLTQKAVFGTDNMVGNRNFYLFNQTDYDVSKYSVRVCFENASGSRYWASMQKVTNDAKRYRATIPADATGVSIYLCDPDKHLVAKSSEGQFNDICYYYVEDITLHDSKNVIYEMTEFSKTSGMTLSLLQ